MLNYPHRDFSQCCFFRGVLCFGSHQPNLYCALSKHVDICGVFLQVGLSGHHKETGQCSPPDVHTISLVKAWQRDKPSDMRSASLFAHLQAHDATRAVKQASPDRVFHAIGLDVSRFSPTSKKLNSFGRGFMAIKEKVFVAQWPSCRKRLY